MEAMSDKDQFQNEDYSSSDEEQWEAAHTNIFIEGKTCNKSIISSSSGGQGLMPEKHGQKDSTIMNRMRLDDNKAGMQGLDRDRISQVILEASKGSRFYENEQRKEVQMQQRLSHQQDALSKLTPTDIQEAEREAFSLVEVLQATRDLNRTIVHIDMDAFYASVEMRDNTDLRSVPMAVGGMSMLSTSNYLARRYGVRAGMPGFIAKKLCPELVIVNTHFEKYREVAAQVREIFNEYDPGFCGMGLDEAYLDLTDHLENRRLLTDKEKLTFVHAICECSTETCPQDVADKSRHDSADRLAAPKQLQCERCLKYKEEAPITFGVSDEEAVKEMRFRIEQRTQLTASAGIAPNTMLAKVCSDQNKPNGQYKLTADVDSVMEFVHSLPIRKVSGIGKVSERMLADLGVTTGSHLIEKCGVLRLLHSQISFEHLMRVGMGLGSTRLDSWGSERKSMSVERTFREIHKPDDLYSKCEELTIALADDLQEARLVGKTITVKLKTVNFKVTTRARSIASYTNSYREIEAVAKDILKSEIHSMRPDPLRLRLMGVRMSSLCDESQVTAQGKQQTLTSLFAKTHSSASQTRTAQVSTYTCPVCSSTLMLTLSGFNRHIDGCLQQKEVLASERGVTVDHSEDFSCMESTTCATRDADSSLQSSAAYSASGMSFEESDRENKTLPKKGTRLLEKSNSHTQPVKSSHAIGEEQQGNRLCKYESQGEKQSRNFEKGSFTSTPKERPLSDSAAPPVIMCPVCNKPQEGLSMASMNKHIDECLNTSTIKDLLCSTTSDSKKPERKKPRLSLAGRKQKAIANEPSVLQFFGGKLQQKNNNAN
ncbi:PREDICTED: DNA polymerase kappa-like [Priapulus caudatus]|uniref:DNA polymerase kappa n=1 Tax=Priapulus caudatus TaxID=37621 RepID=A0ABM1DVD8_PRICU|nr:PREDICTED: DNA polymerase kappa-like [Priapulus caudatus]XP_014663908.1 PREDICTED: DNA polymerase kappa-like [Priapulus caudatus]XP_014663909.1 PREDICTED: DNA polymerase kappa-like [Priapulus caudatus]XP_014663910.1 PREDICTED: DNA polymerase kappa-like [Priapulus caudatus]